MDKYQYQSAYQKAYDDVYDWRVERLLDVAESLQKDNAQIQHNLGYFKKVIEEVIKEQIFI